MFFDSSRDNYLNFTPQSHKQQQQQQREESFKTTKLLFTIQFSPFLCFFLQISPTFIISTIPSGLNDVTRISERVESPSIERLVFIQRMFALKH